MKHAIFRFLIVFFVLTSVSAVLYMSYRALRDTNLNVPSLFPSSAEGKPVISMSGFRLVESEAGRVAWSVEAKRADLLDNKEALLSEVEAVFHNPDGKTAALIGESGTIDTKSGNASVRGDGKDVRIVTSDGYLMTTDVLSWNAARRTVWTKDPFRVLGREIYVEGKGMRADVDLQELKVEGNVKAILQE
jgi:LPS export ABC transporter protein LptC